MPHQADTSEPVRCQIDWVVAHLGYNFQAARLLAEIFRDDRRLAGRADDEFIREMWRQACKERKPRYLDFVCQIVCSHGEPIKRNQDRMIKIVKDCYDELKWNGGWDLAEQALVRDADRHAHGVTHYPRLPSKLGACAAQLKGASRDSCSV